MNWRKIQVLLVDPDDNFANRADRAFKSTNGRAVLGRAHTLAEARARLAAVPADVVVADRRLPDGTAADLLESYDDKPGYPVVVLVRNGEEDLGAAAVEGGAIDSFVKDAGDIRELPRVALRSVREWNHIMERERAEKTILRLRAQVNQFQRLVASGLMERGVAHDIQNLLTPILGFAEVALDKIPPRGQARGEVEQVVRVARIGKELVREALSHGRNGGSDRSTVEVTGIVQDVLELLRPVAPAGVEIRSGRQTPLAVVAADRAQIHRVIVNLCTNAFDAMRSSGGVLQVDVEVVSRSKFDGGPAVKISVTDTGCGMDGEILGRMFDPFFTTKSKGVGLGLGLSMAREIVKAHDGQVTAESETGKGTVVQVTFPLCEMDDGRSNGPDAGAADRPSVVL
ncbi:MAG: ATP-binding protein [Candidatus Latescibacterota bacterium]|jgi:signal transduction histidine kinase